MNPLLVIILSLLGIAAVLFALIRNSKLKKEDKAETTPGIFSGDWWIGSLAIWVMFWIVLFWYCPFARQLVARNPSFFIIAQFLRFGFAYWRKYKVENQTDWRNRPIKPNHYGGVINVSLMIVILFIFTTAIWEQSGILMRGTPPAAKVEPRIEESAQVKIPVSNKAITSAPPQHDPEATKLQTQPIKKVEPEKPAPPPVQDIPAPAPAPIPDDASVIPIFPRREIRPERPRQHVAPYIRKSLIIYPRQVAHTIIPVGYHLVDIEGGRRVAFQQDKLSDGSTHVEFTMIGLEPIRITILCEAD